MPRRDAANGGGRNDIGTIVFSTNANFEHSYVYSLFEKGMNGHHSQKVEIGGHGQIDSFVLRGPQQGVVGLQDRL